MDSQGLHAPLSHLPNERDTPWPVFLVGKTFAICGHAPTCGGMWWVVRFVPWLCMWNHTECQEEPGEICSQCHLWARPHAHKNTGQGTRVSRKMAVCAFFCSLCWSLRTLFMFSLLQSRTATSRIYTPRRETNRVSDR